MVMFIPLAVGLAAGAAGAVAVAVRRRKKKQQEKARQDQGQAHRPSSSNTPVTEQRRRQQEPSRQRQPHDRIGERSATQRKTIAERQHSYRPQPRRLPPYDRRSLVKALDQAIANAANDTLDAALAKPPFNRMSAYEQNQRVSTIADNMRSNLRGLRSPDYNNDILAAAYLLEYHAQHVGLAHAIVNQIVNSRGGSKLIVGDSGRLHVVDLAAGTLAMQFGVAIAVADALIQGELIERVIVDSVDISPAMLKVGRIAWDKFVLNVQNDANLTALAESCQLLEAHRYVLPNAVPERDCECWLSCLHGIYRQNSSELERSLHALHDEHRPIVGLMSCWGRTLEDQNVEIARRISPFQGAGWRFAWNFLPMRADYPVPFLFNREERDAVETANIGHQYGILYNEYPGFLWRPTDTALLTYYRSFSHRDR